MSDAIGEAINHAYISNKIRRIFHPSNFKENSWKFLNNHSGNNLKNFYNRAIKTDPNLYPILYRRSYRVRTGRPAPEGANTNNLKNFRKLPKTKIHPRNTVRMSPPKKGENYVGRKQLKGTCWFQSILNGWLLSTEGRFIMKKKLQAFKQSHEMKPYTNTQSCPRRGVLPVYFWSYVEFMLNPKRNTKNFFGNVMRGKIFSEGKLVRNIAMRRKNQSVVGGLSHSETREFIKIIFSKDEQWKYIDVSTYGSESSSIPEHTSKKMSWGKGNGVPLFLRSERFDLSHAVIAGFGHAIAGYKSRGRYMIYDSNDNAPRMINWQKNPNDVKKYLKEIYGNGKNGNGNFGITAIYIRYVKPSTYNAPAQMKFPGNKYNSNVKENRYTRANYLKFFRNEYNKSNFINTNNKNNNNNTEKIKNYLKFMNYPIDISYMSKAKLLPRLRRMYRIKYGKPAPPGSNVNFFKNKI